MPEFYTFYNGKEKWEKEKELRLSDAYIVKDGEPSLELKVKVINIRPEEHHEILEKCQVLKEYSQFMETVQNYQISGVEEPYKEATTPRSAPSAVRPVSISFPTPKAASKAAKSG